MSNEKKRPLRVCFIADFWRGRAGAELQLLMLLRHIDRKRVEPFVAVLHGSEKDLSEKPACPVHFFQCGYLKSRSVFRDAKKLRTFLRENKIDIIQSIELDNFWLTFVCLNARLCGIKKITGFRVNIGFWLNRKQAFFGKLLNRFFIKKIIANAEACKISVAEQENARLENIVVIPNLIETQRFDWIPAWSASRANHPRRVGMVANLKPIKGTDILLDAAGIVLKQFPDVCFELAGSGGEQNTEQYQQQIDQLGIAGQVKLLGSVADIPAFLSTLDIAVLASRTEGLPNAVMEYMAAGRPCAVTDVGGCGELIHHEKNGLLVLPENPQALAEALLTLLNHPDRAEYYAQSARSDLQTGFEASFLAEKWCEFYEGLR